MYLLTIPRKNDFPVSGLIDEDSHHVRYCGLLKEDYYVAYNKSDNKRLVIKEDTQSVVAEVPRMAAHLFEDKERAKRYLRKHDLQYFFDVEPVFFTDLEEFDPNEYDGVPDAVDCPSCDDGKLVAQRTLIERGHVTDGDYIDPADGDPFYERIEVDVDVTKCTDRQIECDECGTSFV